MIFLPDGDYEITAAATDTAGNTLVGMTKTVSLDIWADTNSSEYTIPSSGDAIEHIGSNASVTAASPVYSVGDGIYAQNTGTGEISIIASSSVQGAGDDGIQVWNAATATSARISAVNVTGLDDGIFVRNLGTEELSISLTGDVVSTSNDTSDDDPSYGIYAVNSGTHSTITTSGDVTSNYHGIYSRNEGSGALFVTSNGTFTALNGNGIQPSNAHYISYTSNADPYASLATDITITANTVTAYGHGIVSQNWGIGSNTVAATGQITATGQIAYGMSVWNGSLANDLSISASNVTGMGGGISAINNGSGVTEVTVSGTIIGQGVGAEGIHVQGGAAATITVESTASVTGDTEGIETRENADVVTVNGSVTGKNGIAIQLNGGTDTVNIGTNATITGTIDGGTGSDTVNFSVAKSAVDTFTYNDTTKTAVVTVDSQVTTFKDFEYFKFSDDESAKTIDVTVDFFEAAANCLGSGPINFIEAFKPL